MAVNKSVICPTCKASVVWIKSSIYRPFCSERCRLIDLGEWASENHKIFGKSVNNPDDENEFILPND